MDFSQIQSAIDTLPPPLPGFVRLWRGKVSMQDAEIPDWMTTQPQFSAIEDATDRWFARTPEQAYWYIEQEMSVGDTADFFYLDVPEEEAADYLVSENEEVAPFSADPENEWFVPSEIAGTALPIMVSATFQFDPNSTQNEGRWRLHDPKFFSAYYRAPTYDNIDVAGVSFVMGTDSRDGKQKPQAVRFNKFRWDEESAADFYEQYKDQLESTWKGWKTSVRGSFVYVKELGETYGA